jgi:hypothetical protein
MNFSLQRVETLSEIFIHIDGTADNKAKTTAHRKPDGHCLGLFCIYNNFFPHNKKKDNCTFGPFPPPYGVMFF